MYNIHVSTRVHTLLITVSVDYTIWVYWSEVNEYGARAWLVSHQILFQNINKHTIPQCLAINKQVLPHTHVS